ncbi:Aste57867_1321 [Aphanomyces stellatus]|uniref:Aste57867_1321 protein n=1 Tax=Aphanomyces stellatus TaxID=120398 RepID=A0A485K5C0_9STRA|nr:hypothetical protein As57867_001320 [Aphanomyces stellatus]VFT78540.1 Aste57867_1321 [Aphanomyces stellatus]
MTTIAAAQDVWTEPPTTTLTNDTKSPSTDAVATTTAAPLPPKTTPAPTTTTSQRTTTKRPTPTTTTAPPPTAKTTAAPPDEPSDPPFVLTDEPRTLLPTAELSIETLVPASSASTSPTSVTHITTTTNAASKEGLSGAAIACIVVGCLVVVCLVVIAFLRCRRREPAKKRLSDKVESERSNLDGGPVLIEMTTPRHVKKSPVPVLSLRNYDSDVLTSMTMSADSRKTDSFHNLYGRPTSESIDSYEPSPHGGAYRNLASPASTVTPMRGSHTFSDVTTTPMSRTSFRRTSDLSFTTSFSMPFNPAYSAASRPSNLSNFGLHINPNANTLRNSDDLSVYSDRSSNAF